MGNRKKQSTITGPTDGQSSGIPSELGDEIIHVVNSNTQLADSFHIKQETGIKQEIVPMGELVEVPASNYRNVTHVVDFDADDDFVSLNLNEVKDELKKEFDNKKDEEPKATNDSVGEDTGGEQDQRPPPQGEDDFPQPESSNNSQNIKERAGDAAKNSRKKHKCNVCEYSAPCKSMLDRHMPKHTGEKPHECDFCPKRFTQKQNLRTHMKAHVEEFLFHCAGCLQGFNRKNEKTAHEMTCNIRRYECHVCKESIGSIKKKIMVHMRVHSGDKPFGCKQCFKQFVQKSHLTHHMKLHAGPRSFRCSKCNQGFSRQDEKNIHEKKCGRHAYKCDICNKTFGLIKSNLIQHMRTHSGEKPFQCRQCAKNFRQTSDLKQHTTIHAKKLPFECLICRQSFFKDNKRKAHQRNCNGRYYECHLCKKFFRSRKTGLEKHMRTHSGESCSSVSYVRANLQKSRTLRDI